MKKILSILLLTTTIYAGDLSLSIYKGTKETRGKLGELSYAISPFRRIPAIVVAPGAGLIFPSNTFGESPKLFVGIMPGLLIRTKSGFYAKALQGISYHFSKHRKSATKHQLPTEVGVGLHRDGVRLGVVFKHFSNGTDSGKNIGLEYYGVEGGFRF